MTATSQLFMRYKIYESYCVFNGEFYEYIKNFQNLKKKQTQKIKYISYKKLLKQ